MPETFQDADDWNRQSQRDLELDRSASWRVRRAASDFVGILRLSTKAIATVVPDRRLLVSRERDTGANICIYAYTFCCC